MRKDSVKIDNLKEMSMMMCSRGMCCSMYCCCN